VAAQSPPSRSGRGQGSRPRRLRKRLWSSHPYWVATMQHRLNVSVCTLVLSILLSGYRPQPAIRRRACTAVSRLPLPNLSPSRRPSQRGPQAHRDRSEPSTPTCRSCAATAAATTADGGPAPDDRLRGDRSVRTGPKVAAPLAGSPPSSYSTRPPTWSRWGRGPQGRILPSSSLVEFVDGMGHARGACVTAIHASQESRAVLRATVTRAGGPHLGGQRGP
jgi:hypothetical protein